MSHLKLCSIIFVLFRAFNCFILISKQNLESYQLGQSILQSFQTLFNFVQFHILQMVQLKNIDEIKKHPYHVKLGKLLKQHPRQNHFQKIYSARAEMPLLLHCVARSSQQSQLMQRLGEYEVSLESCHPLMVYIHHQLQSPLHCDLVNEIVLDATKDIKVKHLLWQSFYCGNDCEKDLLCVIKHSFSVQPIYNPNAKKVLCVQVVKQYRALLEVVRLTNISNSTKFKSSLPKYKCLHWKTILLSRPL